MLKSLALLSSLLLTAGASAVAAQTSPPADPGPSPAESAPATASGSPETPVADPASPQAESEAAFQFALGKILAEERSYRAAQAAFEKAIELDPDDPYLRIEYIALLERSELPVRELTARQGQIAKAMEHAQAALELAPENVDVLRGVGQVYLRLADFDSEAARTAFEILTKVREKEPWDVQTMVALGQIHLSRGEFVEAADIFDQASRYVPNNRILYNFLADARERAGQEDEAAAALERILDLDPGDLGTRIRLAELLGRAGQHERALELLESAPPSVQQDERLAYLRARELFANERPEDALELLDTLDGGGEQVRRNRRLRLYVTDLRARILASLDRGDEALEEMTKLLDLDPGNVDLLRRVTRQMAMSGRQEDARRMLEDFIEHHTGEGSDDDVEVAGSVQTARLALAALLVEEESWDPALTVLAPMLSADDPEARLVGAINTAEVLHQAGRQDEAIDLLTRNDPDEPPLVRKRVELLLRAGEDGRAKKAMRSLRRSDNLDLGLAAVQAFHAAERFDDTVPVLEELVQKHPKSIAARFLLGAALERTGAAEPAAEAFLAILEADSDHAQTLNYLGYMWADRGEHLERALELVQRAVKLDPDNGAYVDSLGWAHYRLGHFTEAREHLERAVRLAPGDPVVYEHLGDVYAALGENGKAAEQYRRALQVAAQDGGSGQDQDLEAVQRKLDELKVD